MKRMWPLLLVLVLIVAACASTSSDAVEVEPSSPTTTEMVSVAEEVEVEASSAPTTAAPSPGDTTASTTLEPQLVEVSAADIEAALSGNTITGTWLGEPYTQFYDPEGVTTYLPESGRESQGLWRVNTETGQYESLWGGETWDTYDVLRDGDQWFWSGQGVELQPFTISQGNP